MVSDESADRSGRGGGGGVSDCARSFSLPLVRSFHFPFSLPTFIECSLSLCLSASFSQAGVGVAAAEGGLGESRGSKARRGATLWPSEWASMLISPGPSSPQPSYDKRARAFNTGGTANSQIPWA